MYLVRETGSYHRVLLCRHSISMSVLTHWKLTHLVLILYFIYYCKQTFVEILLLGMVWIHRLIHLVSIRLLLICNLLSLCKHRWILQLFSTSLVNTVLVQKVGQVIITVFVFGHLSSLKSITLIWRLLDTLNVSVHLRLHGTQVCGREWVVCDSKTHLIPWLHWEAV